MQARLHVGAFKADKVGLKRQISFEHLKSWDKLLL